MIEIMPKEHSSSFDPNPGSIVIPREHYKPIKKCPYCSSIFITDTLCESCGRNLKYDPVDRPFGQKSFFSIKERYLDDFDVVTKYFPFFENKNSKEARAYCRKLMKRLTDLLDYFEFREMYYDEDSIKERKLFFIECKIILEELLNYNEDKGKIRNILLDRSDGLIQNELINQLEELSFSIKPEMKIWFEQLIYYKPIKYFNVKNYFYLFFGSTAIFYAVFQIMLRFAAR